MNRNLNIEEANYESVGRGASAPERVLSFANKLGKTLGYTPKVTYEASGYHIYVPCPSCIAERGRAEMADPKLAINADKYLGLTREYELKHEQNDSDLLRKMNEDAHRRKRQRSCCCMRALGGNTSKGDGVRHLITVDDLLNSPPYEDRFPELKSSFKRVTDITDASKESNWVLDPCSNKMVPPPPGDVWKLSQVHEAFGDDHPVFVFIRQRGFDWRKLEQQFGAGFCIKEWPHGQNRVWHRDMPDGWKDTPQGRLILYTYKDGVPVTWQARVLEWDSECKLYKYHFHPYRAEWVMTHSRPTLEAAWIPIGVYGATNSNGTLQWKPSKYKTATHSYRGSALMGWDAAIQMNYSQDVKWCAIGEGPLDAARVGAGGLACLGKTLPGALPRLVAESFEVVFTIFDNDKAGKRATEQVGGILKRSGGVIREVVSIPVGFGKKDVGEMTDFQWQQTFEPFLQKYLS